MKVVTFERKGARSYGLLEENRVIDVGNRLASRYNDLRSVLNAGAECGHAGRPNFSDG
jgi:hypothetical protein